jgi:hypothetical protein
LLGNGTADMEELNLDTLIKMDNERIRRELDINRSLQTRVNPVTNASAATYIHTATNLSSARDIHLATETDPATDTHPATGIPPARNVPPATNPQPATDTLPATDIPSEADTVINTSISLAITATTPDNIPAATDIPFSGKNTRYVFSPYFIIKRP